MWQDINHWVERAHALSKNFISQLASLFNERQRLYIQSFKGVHLLKVFRSLAELLQVCRTTHVSAALLSASPFGPNFAAASRHPTP